MTFKRLLFLAALLALLAGAGLLWHARQQGVELRFTAQQLQHKLAERMPIHKPYGPLELTLQDPRVRLSEGSARIQARMQVTVAVPSLGRSWQGDVEASSGLRYEAAEGAFYLNAPAIERISAPGMPERYATLAGQAASSALQRFYALRPVHVLEPTAKGLATRMLLREVHVHNGALVAKLGMPDISNQE